MRTLDPCHLITVLHAAVELEQIPTSAHLAARMMFTAANEFEDIAGCDVMDLGCGTGMLSIASFYLGASGITSFDIDSEALEVAKHNCSKLEIAEIDFVQANVADLCLHHGTYASPATCHAHLTMQLQVQTQS